MTTPDDQGTESLLVVSAHAGDFVWRAGGALALAASRGERSLVLCLSFGERGESAKARLAGKELDEIKALRREEASRAAEVLGADIELLDAIQQTFFLYLYELYEPGGNRIELCNPMSRLIFAPDWQTVTWSEAERAKGQAWGLKTISSFHTHGTPPVQ